MAVEDLSLDLTISDQCPDYVFTDDTDYLPVKKRFEFKFHDYLTTPTGDTSSVLTQIRLTDSSLNLLTTTVEIFTTTSGDIEDPEDKYNELIQALVTGASGVTGVLNKNASTDYKDWHLDISGFISQSTIQPDAVAVTYSPNAANLSPSVVSGNGDVNEANGGVLIEGRNLNIYDPSGKEIDLGQVAQVDTFTLLNTFYQVGDSIEFDICGNKVTYNVEEGKTDRQCVLEGILNAYNSAEGATKEFTDTISAEISGDSILFTAKTKGVPFKFVVSGLTIEVQYTYETTTANVSSFDIPSPTASNVITYQPDEEGGTYDITLTVFVGCTYKICKYKSNNWCASLKKIDCCIQELVLQQSCTNCNKIRGLNEKLDLLRANRDALNIMLVDQYNIADINDLVQSSLSVCKKCKCGCK